MNSRFVLIAALAASLVTTSALARRESTDGGMNQSRSTQQPEETQKERHSKRSHKKKRKGRKSLRERRREQEQSQQTNSQNFGQQSR